MIIGLLKNYPAAITLAETENLDMSQIAVSQITRIELLGYSNLERNEELAIHAFLENCRILKLDEAVEHSAIQLRRSKSCKLPDAIICATAQVHQLKLLTLDQRLQTLVA
ncbi:MAG: type II toxin-antitoxin system VapC family toxin [Gallionellaceae bacterium]|jgi:hypothetical protein